MLATSVISLFVFLLLITNGGRLSFACGSLAVALLSFFSYLYQLCSHRPARHDLDPWSQRRRSSLLNDKNHDSLTPP
jgi:hypothetical protein